MKVDLGELKKRADYINYQKHPTLDLLIFNYNQHCQFERKWDEYTLMARGLITDLEGNIVSRPFRKFFNWGEYNVDVKIMVRDNPIIYQKFDGSLGIQYYDGDVPRIATRGSFSSDQALWASGWMITSGFRKSDFLDGKTYLWEIIYPENRIVVNYGDRAELVLLAVVDTETGQEDPSYFVESEGERLKVAFAKHLVYEKMEEVISNVPKDEEGYVFHWPLYGYRLKVKGEEYVRLHRLLTQISSKSIWELLKNNQSFDELLEKVPDEFFDWVTETRDGLIHKYVERLEEARKALSNVGDDWTRKNKALFIVDQKAELRPVMFALIDHKDPWVIIWRQLKPKFEKAFSKDIDA